MPSPTPATLRWRSRDGRLVGAAVCCLLLLLVVAASAGTVQVWHDPPPGSPIAPIDLTDTEPTGDPITPGSLPATPGGGNDLVATTLAALIVILVGVFVATLIVFIGRRLARRSPRPDRDRPPISPLPHIDPAVVIDAEAQLHALHGGEPRNAIVACWLLLEVDVAAAGLPRRASETSAEYTERVLASSSLDPDSITDLAELYREARFSRHALDDAARARALDALRRVHAGLQPA